MSEAVALLQAILGGHYGRDEALVLLERALEREVDPLDYCAATLGIGQMRAMERAAAFIGLPFLDAVPLDAIGSAPEPIRLDMLAHIRAFKVRIDDGDIFFNAPSFFDLLRLKTRLAAHPDLAHRLCLVPAAALRDYLARMHASVLIDEARQRLARRWPYASADLDLTWPIRFGFVALMLGMVTLVLAAPFLTQAALLPLVVILLLIPATLRFAAILNRPRPAPPPRRPEDAELPVYSVLIPLRDEAGMVPQLVAAMRAIDYPAEKLDIKFVVEDRSLATILALSAFLDDPRFELLAVPDAPPRTKPKALDFALPLCRGEFVVVYDAEDRPHPDQLWRAVCRFRDESSLECLQAELRIDNAGENGLSVLFAGEYAGHFRVLLPALADWSMPMPLGGTSNHFRLDSLRALGGWDAYNVTEDADLGIRLARLRLACATLDLPTLEEAPTTFSAWMGQRTRWMKGWMQTLIVHNRRPLALLRELGLLPFLIFEITALGTIVSPLLHAGFLLVLLARLALGMSVVPHEPEAWMLPYLSIFILGYGGALALPMAGLLRQNRPQLCAAQCVLPLYWMLMAFATLRALGELLFKPFQWNKTQHRPASRKSAGPFLTGAEAGGGWS